MEDRSKPNWVFSEREGVDTPEGCVDDNLRRGQAVLRALRRELSNYTLCYSRDLATLGIGATLWCGLVVRPVAGSFGVAKQSKFSGGPDGPGFAGFSPNLVFCVQNIR